MITNPIVVDMDVGTPQVVPMTISGKEPIPMGFSEAINLVVDPTNLEDKTVAPTEEVQSVTYDYGFAGLRTVTVNPIPSNYGKITWDGITLMIT